MALEVGDLVLCTVDRIAGTVVFVKIEDDREGNIVTSEIAPGRIRNLRDYVVPKKKIVCKVLRIDNYGNTNLSLRRVSAKERKEVLEKYSEELSSISILKSILKDKADKIIEIIKKDSKVLEFLQEAKENPKLLDKLFNKEEAEKLTKIIQTQKQKKAIVKKEFLLKSKAPNGLSLIKELLENVKEVEIKYLSAGRYIIKAEATDLKSADQRIHNILLDVEKKSKKLNMDFSVKEK